jgi:hypothetical protein
LPYSQQFDKAENALAYLAPLLATKKKFCNIDTQVSTFGIGIENITSAAAAVSMSGLNVTTSQAGVTVAGVAYSSAANESLMRRAQASQQDPVFQKIKSEFTSNFDFSQPGSMKLQNLILKLKKWIKILEAKTKVLPKSFLVSFFLIYSVQRICFHLQSLKVF